MSPYGVRPRPRRAAASGLPHISRKTARRRPRRLHPSPHEGPRRPRSLGRSFRRPALPRPRRSSPPHEAPEPRPRERPLSLPTPGHLGAEEAGGLARTRTLPHRPVRRAHGVLGPREASPRRSDPRVRPGSRQPVPRSRHSRRREDDPDDRDPPSSDHPRPRARDGTRTQLVEEARRVALLFVREDARSCGEQDAAHRRREREQHQGHQRRHGCVARPHATRAGGCRPPIVRTAARGDAHSGTPHHHGVGRRGVEGSALLARSHGQVAHRARPDSHHHRQAETGQEHGPHPEARTRTAHPVRVGCARRAHRRALRRSRTGRGSLALRGLQPPGHRGHVHRNLSRGHRRRGPARGHRGRRRHRSAVQGR